MDRKNKLDKHFSERFSNYSHPYKPELWNDLEGRLNQKSSNKKLIYFAVTSLVIVALSGVVFITYIANNKVLTNKQVAEQTAVDSENNTLGYNEITASKKEIKDDIGSDKTHTEGLGDDIKSGDKLSGLATRPAIINMEVPIAATEAQLTQKPIINSAVIPAEPVWQADLPLKDAKQNNTQTDKGFNGKLFSGFHFYGAIAETRAFGTTNFNTNLIYGVGYHKLFPSKWSVNIEALYMQRKNVSISRETNQTRYFLIKEQSKTVLITDRFEYLQVPLYITYPFNNKLNINVGGYLDVLLSSNNVIHKIYEDSETKTTRKGVYKGINYTSGGIMLGVNYEISPRLYMDFRLHKGIYKPLDENYYNNQTNQLTEFQFGLRLDI